MARRRGLAKYKVAEMTPSGPVARKPVKKHILFGTPDDRKTIIIMSIVGFVLVALAYWLVAKDDPGFSIPALLFTALHGGLMGMLLGQLILVYPDRVVVIFTVLAILVGELAFVVGSGQTGGFRFNRVAFQAMTALFFWAGFIGFWVGFMMYVRREGARGRFQRRFDEREEEQQKEQQEEQEGEQETAPEE